MRDALTFNARSAIDRATDRMQRSGGVSSTWHTGDDVARHVRAAYLLGKRSIAESAATDSAPSTSQASSTAIVHVPTRSSVCNANASSSSAPMTDLTEIDAYINNLMGASFLTHQVVSGSSCDSPPTLNVIAYIDSQATNFVVPDTAYLSRIDSTNPDINVETANGVIRPDAVGEAVISLFDDEGKWHTFTVSNVWAMHTCGRVLYSQSAMRGHGVTHRLDDGYIMFNDGSRKSISPTTFAVELTINTGSAVSSRDQSQPCDSSGSAYAAKASIPQKLLWQRLGCPSEKIWSSVCDVTTDHGLPPSPHLKHNFEMPEAVARARARLLPYLFIE